MAGTDPRPGAAPPVRGLLPFVAALGLASVGLGLLAGRLPGAPDSQRGNVAVLLVLLLLAGALGIEFRTRGEGDTLDLFEAALAVGLLALPAPVLLPLVALTKGLTLTAQRVPPYKTVFNLVQWTCAAAAGGLVLAFLRVPGASANDDLLLLVPALIVVWAVNTGAVLAVLRLHMGRTGRSAWRSSSPSLATGAGINAVLSLSLGLLFAAVWAWQPAAWPVLPVALIAVHLAARGWAQQHAGESRLVGLQRASAALAGPQEVRPATARFLSELRQAFTCRTVQLHLRAAGDKDAPTGVAPGPDGWVREAAGDGDADVAAALVAQLLDTGVACRLPGRTEDAALAALLAGAGWRDALVAPVRLEGRVVGLLCAIDREGWEGFETGELAVLEAAASVLGEALHRSELTELVQRERAALHLSEARWRALVQHASDLVLVVDHADTVSYASPASRRMLGRPESSLRGTSLLALVHPDDRPLVREVLQDMRSAVSGARRALELRMPTAHGSWRSLEVVVSDLLGDGAVDAIVLNARDVTERRRIESMHADQAYILELVARGAPLRETLRAVVAGLDEQSSAAGCGLVVGGQAQPPVLVTAGLTAECSAALDRLLRRMLAQSVIAPEAREEAATSQAPGPRRTPVPAERSAGAEPVTTVLDLGRRPDEDSLRLVAGGVHVVRVRELLSAVDPAVRGLLAVCGGPAQARAGGAAQGWADDWLVESAAGIATLAVDHFLVQHRLAHQAAHDALTDLPNRDVFLDRLGQALHASDRGESLVLVLFLDLDRFKMVNDSLGHRAGDALLQAVADRLRQAVRPSDTVARFGGDEFTMLCEDITDEAHALYVVERVQEALARPFPLGDSELFATTSIGLALARGSARTPETLVEDADAAMYRAKERGGNCFEVFDAAMRDRAMRRLDTQSALHRALGRQEFRVVYQPTVDLADGQVVGVEALVRWDRPGKGVVLPDEFIPLAEETGLILPIGAQVLEQACLQAAAWRGTGPGAQGPAVHVNLSARQLTDPGLVGLVRDVLKRTATDPGAMILEITESALIRDVAASTATLHQLKDLGVRLFVDDFGTGYSSLTYLQRFPVDGVKVDRSFVAGLGRAPDAEAIVRAVVGLAHSLGLVVVAEGVETAQQVHKLRELDCEVAQGYFLGRPLPAREVSLLPRVLELPRAPAPRSSSGVPSRTPAGSTESSGT